MTFAPHEPTETTEPTDEKTSDPSWESKWADPKVYADLSKVALGFIGSAGGALGTAAVVTGKAAGSAAGVAGEALGDAAGVAGKAIRGIFDKD